MTPLSARTSVDEQRRKILKRNSNNRRKGSVGAGLSGAVGDGER
jgi:hypothetical protein